MSLTFQQEVSNGVQTLYPLEFEYLNQDDVYVYTGDAGDYQIQVPYQWADSTTIELTDLVAVPAGTAFKIRRVMTRTALIREFENKSIRGAAVDSENYHSLYLLQEVQDGFLSTDGVLPAVGNLDMQEFRIVNQGDPVDQTDGINAQSVSRLIQEANIPAGGVDIGYYLDIPAPTITDYNQFLKFVRGTNVETYKLDPTKFLPYTVNAIAVPDPLNDSNLIRYESAFTKLQTIARITRVQDNQVILASNTTKLLDTILYLYDDNTDVVYAKPSAVADGQFIATVVGNQLTTNLANVYTLSNEGRQYPIDVVADIANLPALAGARVHWGGYIAVSDGGGNWGTIKLGVHVADDGSIFSISPTAYVEANLKGNQVSAKKFGARGNFTNDDKARFTALWTWAPWGTKLFYPEGHYKITGGIIHPLKQLYHVGIGRSPSNVPTALNIKGTSFVFPTFVGVNKGGLYMPPPDGLGNTCRFSSLTDIMLFGDGTNDDNGTVTCLKINNLGTHLTRVDSRYGAVSIEFNYSVGARVEDVKLFASTFAAYFVYDVATPFGLEKNSVCTANTFVNVQVATSSTNVAAIGWYQDATCAYAGNTLTNFDAEQAYTGATYEGRIAAKDHDGIEAHGSASFQSAGNIIDGSWAEANTGQNLVLSYDPGTLGPALIFRGMFQDVAKITTADDSQLMITTAYGMQPLKLGTTKDGAQGDIGQWGTPFTAGQYLAHGPRIVTPDLKVIVQELIAKKAGNRTTINEKAGYRWAHAKDAVPFVASTVNLANIELYPSAHKSVMIAFQMEGTTTVGSHYSHHGTLVVDNDFDVITSSLLSGMSFFRPGGAPLLTLQGSRVTANTFGIFLFKEPALTEIVNITVTIECTVSGGSDNDRQSTLTTFSV